MSLTTEHHTPPTVDYKWLQQRVHPYTNVSIVKEGSLHASSADQSSPPSAYKDIGVAVPATTGRSQQLDLNTWIQKHLGAQAPFLLTPAKKSTSTQLEPPIAPPRFPSVPPPVPKSVVSSKILLNILKELGAPRMYTSG